jgi:uncharacterized integral membrane protein
MKELSARKYMVIVFSTTYCIIMIGITIALLKKILLVETYIATVAGFTYVIREIADKYFARQDRVNGKEAQNGKAETLP